MFESLADKIKQDEAKSTSTSQRVALWSAVTVITLVVFGGLYLAVRALG